MSNKSEVHLIKLIILAIACIIMLIIGSSRAHSQVNTDPPASTVKTCWIHHSCGSNWTHQTSTDPSYGGNLGLNLNNNNYYITECDYDWDAELNDNLGDNTNTEDWHLWFNDTKMPYVYLNSSHYDWTNTIADPGGDNSIIMFKSCYPCSEVGGSIDDEKAIYNDLLAYFGSRTDKLFVLITPPGETVVSSWSLTEELCNWLCDRENGWLSRYPYHNVAVFDFYNVLSEIDAHHRIYEGSVQHYNSPSADGTSPYHDGDDHPNSTGNQKSTDEFVTLLNYFYNCWQDNPIRINFQPGGATVPSGYVLDNGSSYGTGINYGWTP